MAFNNTQSVQTEKPIWLCALSGAAVGIGFSLAVFVILAIVMSFAALGEGMMRPFVMGTSVVACLLGGVVSAKKMGGKGAVAGLLAGLGYILILYLISSFTITGFVFDTYLIIMILIGVVAGGIGGIAGVNMAAGKRYRR